MVNNAPHTENVDDTRLSALERRVDALTGARACNCSVNVDHHSWTQRARIDGLERRNRSIWNDAPGEMALLCIGMPTSVAMFIITIVLLIQS